MKQMLSTAAACALAVTAMASAQEAPTATASLVGADGQDAGTAELTGTPDGVLIDVEIEGLPAEQWVAVHVHETGACDADTDFESAGGHYNPTDADHGYLVEGGPHAGDMPNQYVGANGTLRAQVFNSFVTLDGGETDIRGLALMIHGGEDDYESQPSGDAGAREACAVIE